MAPVRRSALALALMLSLSACFVGGDRSAGDPIPSDVLIVHTSSGEQRFQVELAATPESRAEGLMDRERLDPDTGMAFTWSDPVRTSFWMKDTLVPLSIAFWDESWRIVAMFDMDPCTADPCPTYDPGVEILGAVEVAQGELERRGIDLGDRVEIAGAA
jgi:uncharacterized membrane protein (UPF0127 family)